MPLPWWAQQAEEVFVPDPNEEGGPIFPDYHAGSSVQGSRSVYSGRTYSTGQGTPRPAWEQRRATQEEADAEARHAKMLAELVYYILVKMEPTDRCLRMPGDIFDYKRLCAKCGLEHYGDKRCERE